MPAYIQQHACRPPLSGMEAVRVQCSRSFGTSFELLDSLGPQGWKEQGNYLAWRLWEYSTVGLLEATSFKLPDSFRPQGWKEQGNYLAWEAMRVQYSRSFGGYLLQTSGLLPTSRLKRPRQGEKKVRQGGWKKDWQGWKKLSKAEKKNRQGWKKVLRLKKRFPGL